MQRFLRVAARYMVACALAVCAISVSHAQQTQTTPEVKRGLQWLAAQMQTDGSLLNETQSIATQLQSRTEAARTLKLLATLPASAVTRIDAETEDNTEYLSRKVIALALNGWDPTTYVDLLLQRQNADGGFGGATGYSSNLLDTAWTALALAQANKATANASSRARGYLLNQLVSDGGMPGRSDPNRIQYSALALLALQTTPDGSNATAINALASWLLQRQAGDGSWSGNLYLTAFVLAAMSPVTADDTVRSSAGTFLVSKQAADGSWNGDPFLTALVLRALATKYTPPLNTSNGVLKGQVVDAGTNAALSGATVVATGPVNKTTATDAAGNFVLEGLTSGTYSLALTRSGYGSASASYTVITGQTSDAGAIGLKQVQSAAILRGQVTGASTKVPLAGVAITVTGSATVSVTTDADGRYELIGIAPGTFSITASLSGYQSASGSGTAVAGGTAIFSPTLYTNSETALTSVRYVGKVVASGKATALAGVAIQVTGTADATATTSETGLFDMTLNAGSYTASFTLSGYDSVTQTFIAPAGTTVDAGMIVLSPIKTTSSITGRVTTSSNVAITGASVQVVGTSVVVTSAADGTYTLDNVAGTELTIRASATGYNSQAVNFQLSAPGNVVQNFSLTPQKIGTLAIGDLVVASATVGSGTNVAVATAVTNTGSDAGTAVVQLQVLDKDKKVVGTGIAYDANGHVVGQLNIAAGQQQDIKLVWNSAQFAPGDYVLAVRLLETDSITQATPQGNLIAERAGSVSITSQAHFAGTITSNPPVLQAGTNTAVKFSAVVQNDGNTEIPAQAFTLAVINTKDNTVVLSNQIAAGAIPVNGLQSLSFPDWTSTKGGDFRLELTAADAALGKVVGSLYVGDAARAAYTVNKLVVPAGTQTVRGTIKVTGQDIADGSISDPLAPLVKTAIQKSVTYNDREAVAWTSRNQCLGCHIQTQALVGGELNRRFATFDAGQRNSIYNYLRGTQQADGSYYNQHPEFRATSSMLTQWALDSWHDKNDVAPTLVKGADYLLTQQQTDGRWNYSHPWLGNNWTSATDHTALNVKSLVGLSQSLPQVPAWRLLRYQTSPYFSGTLPVSRGFLANDTAGNFYMSVQSQGKVVQIKPDGTTGATWSGLNDPSALVQAKDGNGMLVATANGLHRLTSGGAATKLNSNGGLANLVYGPDGKLYSRNFATNAIYQIDDAGADSIYLLNSALNGPAGFAFADNGDLYVTSYNARSVLRIKSDKTIEAVLTGTAFQGNPLALIRYDGSWLLGTTTRIYRLDDQWKVVYSQANRADNFLALANNTVLFTTSGQAGIQKLVPVPLDVNAKLAQYAQSINKATTWMQNLDPNSTADTLALAHQLLALGEASKFYANDTARYNAVRARMVSIADKLKARQRSDGSWGVAPGYAGDSFVTAHVGYGLDYLNPSPDDPYVRKAVQWLLSRQQADGSWLSENGLFGTHLATTTWVSIWLPVMLDRLGGIDTDLTVTFPANVKMSNPDRAPTTTKANGDGSTTVIWKMIGVTSAGQTINYDLSLVDMKLDEARVVSTDAHLTFKNTFTGGVVDAPIEVPLVKASAFLDLGVATDKQSYSADQVVSIVGQATNTAANLSSGKVKFDIYAPDSTLVANLTTIPFKDLAAGTRINLPTSWNTGRTFSGNGYYVLATLYDTMDRSAGTAQTLFNINGSGAASSDLTAKITADKQLYLPSDTVKLVDRVTNTTVNAPMSDLRIVTKVTNSDGSLLFTKSETLPQLMQGALKDYSYNVPLRFGAAGTYSATLVVNGGDGTSLAEASTTFAVASTADTGSGLTGTIAVTPKEVPQGDPVAISFSTVNSGNSVLANMPLMVTIVDPVAQKVMAEYPYAEAIAHGSSYKAAVSWISTGEVGTNYVVVLTAVVGAKTLTLAQDSFKLGPPPIKLDIKQAISNSSRVLALISCASGEHGDDDDHDENDRGDKDRGDDQHRDSKNRDDKDEDDSRDSSKRSSCITARVQAIDKALTALGVPHTIVTNETAFKQAFRSGLYNTYWLSGKQEKLHDGVVSEIREAVFSGDSLIQDGVHGDERNKPLHAISGVRFHGRVAVEQKVTLSGSFYPEALLVPMTGDAARLEVTGDGKVQGTFTTADHGSDYGKGNKDEDSDEKDHHSDSKKGADKGGNKDGDKQSRHDRTGIVPAVVSNAFGAGRTLTFGFDLAVTLAKEPAAWADPLNTSFAALVPAMQATLTPGALLPVKTSIANLARAVNADMKSSLPQDAVYLGSNPTATYDTTANVVGWAFSLPESQTQDLFLTLRVPPVAGSYTLKTVVSTVKDSSAKPYGDPLLLSMTVIGADTAAADAVKRLQAFDLTDKKERKLRDRLLEELQEALAHFNKNTARDYEIAIGKVTDVGANLSGLTSVDTAAVRDAVYRILKEAQWRWTQMPPSKPKKQSDDRKHD